MITVIADDITGAAELAGVAHSHGLTTVLAVEAAPGVYSWQAANVDTWGIPEVFVIATDTRSVAANEAAVVTGNATRALCHVMPYANGHNTLFRKLDSVLRGNIEEETYAVLANSPYERALHLPANPSKNRIIRGGVYYIDGVPIDQTPFRNDPEFPARTAVLRERFPELSFADAETVEDVRHIVEKTPADTLLCGGVDLFTALLERDIIGKEHRPRPKGNILSRDGRLLVVRGSTLSKPIPLGLPVAEMDDSVFYGTMPAGIWARDVAEQYLASEHGLIVAVGAERPILKGRGIAARLRHTMSIAVAGCVSAAIPDELVIEGGATAFAILHRLPWRSFTVSDEIAPGVVRLAAADGPHITLKPGSYDWGPLWQ